MRKTIWAAVPLALLALAAPAAAKDGAHAVTYKARLAPVAVEAPAASASKHDKAEKRRGDKRRGRDDRSEQAGVRGKAELVDGGRRDKVQVRVRGLVAGETYAWSVRKAAEGEDACAGEAVEAFEYAPLEARRRGHGKARARSLEFAAEDGAVYAIVVTDAEGADVACGEFARKGKGHEGADEVEDEPGDDHGDETESESEDD